MSTNDAQRHRLFDPLEVSIPAAVHGGRVVTHPCSDHTTCCTSCSPGCRLPALGGQQAPRREVVSEYSQFFETGMASPNCPITAHVERCR